MKIVSDVMPITNSISLKKIWPVLIALALLLLPAGCAVLKKEAPVTRERALKRIWSFWHPAFFDDLGYNGLADSIKKSLSYLKKIPLDKQYRFGKDVYAADHLIRSLTRFQNFIERIDILRKL